jgi:hypothetical protein
MKGARRRLEGKGALDLIEAATHLLRAAPAAALAIYYVGAIPFVLGLLFFWADMSRSAFADQHLAEASLAMAVLFLWMKFWQAMFCRRMRAHVSGEPPARWTFRRCVRVFLNQAIVQPSALFLLPPALIFVLPFPWVYAFYQNATALADGPARAGSQLLKNSWKQTSLWPTQNVTMLIILAGFSFYVFLNLTVVSMLVPQLIKMFFGIETIFTKSAFSMLNTTFFTAMFALTYLCVDPILKVLYTLRCFYGESLQSGEDLRAELKQFTPAATRFAAALTLMLALAGGVWSARAGESAPVPAASPTTPPTPLVSPTGVSPTDLDRAINDTIHERKYVWRSPREKTVEPESEKGVIGKFLDKVSSMVRKWVNAGLDWLDKMLRKLFQRKLESGGGGSGEGWMVTLQLFLYVLVAAAVIALVVLLFRVWQKRRQLSGVVASEAIQPLPDLADENVGADELPEDGWTKLARELLERGEFRLAMRAFYLASLAQLAQRNLLQIARFKSNRDYERELRRRGHSFPTLLTVFGDNVSVFERIWYGMYDVNRELVNEFAANVERMRSAG